MVDVREVCAVHEYKLGQVLSRRIEKWLFSRKKSVYAMGVSALTVDYLVRDRTRQTRRIGAKDLRSCLSFPQESLGARL
jgi:hypothetical protein